MDTIRRIRNRYWSAIRSAYSKLLIFVYINVVLATPASLLGAAFSIVQGWSLPTLRPILVTCNDYVYILRYTLHYINLKKPPCFLYQHRKKLIKGSEEANNSLFQTENVCTIAIKSLHNIPRESSNQVESIVCAPVRRKLIGQLKVSGTTGSGERSAGQADRCSCGERCPQISRDCDSVQIKTLPSIIKDFFPRADIQQKFPCPNLPNITKVNLNRNAWFIPFDSMTIGMAFGLTQPSSFSFHLS